MGRPGTPFPHTHQISHHHQSSYDFSHQPLHFAVPALPSPTPPSLLMRSSSSGSSSSTRRDSTSSTPSPPFMGSNMRRVSTSSTVSSSMPATPVLDLEVPHAPPPTPCDASETLFSIQGSLSPLAMPPPDYNWSDKAITSNTAFAFSYSSKRPPLVRRDTPRPTTTTLQSLAMSSTEDVCTKRRRPLGLCEGWRGFVTKH